MNESVSEEYLIKFHDEVFRIETTPFGNEDSQQGEGEERIKKPDCDFCKVCEYEFQPYLGCHLLA